MAAIHVTRLAYDQRGFLLLVAAVGLVRLVVLARGGGTGWATWSAIGGLWASGAVWAAVVHRRCRYPRTGDLLGLTGVQNVAIQAAIGLPATAAGVVRLAAGAGGGTAFIANAIVTVLVFPMLAAVVGTFAALLLAVPVRALLGMPR